MPGASSLRNSLTSGHWSIVAATAWMLVFTGFAMTLELPNNREFDRLDVLAIAPSLFDLLLPPEAQPGESPQARMLREHTGWRYFPQRLDPLCVAALILAGAWGIGHLLLRGIGIPLPRESLERTVFAIGLGLTTVSLMTLLAGLAGALSRPLLGGFLAAAILGEGALRWFARNQDGGKDSGFGIRDAGIAGAPSLRKGGAGGVASNRTSASNASLRSHLSGILRGGDPLHWFWLIVLAPFLLAMVLGAALPSVDFDVNEYHFLGPKEYFQNGHITFLPHNVYTSFPFGTEMLTLLAMVLRGDWYQGALAGKCVLMTFGPLTGLGLFAAGRRWFGPTAGAFAAVLYLTTPWTYRISTIAYAEGGLSFYLFAALFAVMIAFEIPRERGEAPADSGAPQTDRADGRSRAPLYLLAGAFAGSAMACKYPGVVSVVIPLFLAMIWKGMRTKSNEDQVPARREPRESRLMPIRATIGPYLLGVALTIGPWLVKNAIETGNPVYPLLYTVFGGRDWDAELNAKWRNGHRSKDFSFASSEPFKMSLVYSAVDVAARNDWVNSLLFACAGLTWFCRDVRRKTTGLWLFTGYLFLTWWLLTHRIDRFWVPMTPVLALLAGGGAEWLMRTADPDRLSSPWSLLGRISRGSFGFCVALVTFANLVVIVSGLGGYNEFLLDMAQARPRALSIESPEIALLNERLPPGSKVLSVGDAELFEARFPVVYNTVFDRSIFEEWFSDETSLLPPAQRPLREVEAIRSKLAAEGITHIYVNWQDILRYRLPGNYGYTEFVTPGRFAELRRMGVLGAPWSIPTSAILLDDLPFEQGVGVQRLFPELVLRIRGEQLVTVFEVYPVTRQ